MASADEPRLVHVLPGRVRLHIPDLAERDARAIEAGLRAVPGVRLAVANALTCNVLVRFDPQVAAGETVLGALRALGRDGRDTDDDNAPSAGARVRNTLATPTEAQTSPTAHTHAPRVLTSGSDGRKSARIAVRGLDRDPDLSRRVVAHLERRPGVRARANPLTGRVLVEFNEHLADIDDLLTDVVAVELPDLPDEDNPSHPLDPAPLVQSAARTIGAGVGLSIITVQQVAGVQVATPGAAHAAGIIGILQGFPLTRFGLRALLGRDRSDLVLSGASIVTLALAGSPLGLALTGMEALRLLSEVVARRAAWRRYEERLEDVAEATPGATVRLEAGERTPREATVVEGTGTAIGHDGAPLAVAPGSVVPSGARLFGGPFVMDLHAGHPFTPQPRPAPPAPALPERYQQALGPVSLAYALATAGLTRSPARAFEALLLVNPRVALIGAEAASTGAAARALRAGVVVVGSRSDRPICRPDVLLLDGPRTLTDGLELGDVVLLGAAGDVAERQGLAAAVAGAAGSPWGGAFHAAVRAADCPPARDGRFDGATAHATVDGIPYTLGPVARGDIIDNTLPAAEQFRHHGATPLVLRDGREAQPLALFALQPRLAPDVADLVATCRRHGVEIAVVGVRGSLVTTGAVAGRAGVPLLNEHDIVAAVRARQEDGARVAVLSDSAHAAAAFANCDLAIGLSSGRSNRFAARADLLAPNLAAVAAIVEAGARRDVTARDSVALSLVANVAGAIWGWRGGAGIERASTAVYLAGMAALVNGWARLRGGSRASSTVALLAAPPPER